MKFQPELDKAQMMWRRISSYKNVPSGAEGTASNCLRAYRIARLMKAVVLNAPACCFHQDLGTCTVAALGHCSVSEFERSLPPTAQGYRAKGTELLP